MFPHVSTEALMCALVLAEEGNLGRTAERLHTSHSNVGRKVKTLQSSWGVELFRRNLTGFDLTDEGRFALREIRKSMEHVQRGFDHALYLSVRHRRPLMVGHSIYIQQKVLPWLERQTVSGTEFSRIKLKADTTVHLMRRVLRGQLHIGAGVMPIQDKDLWVECLGREYFGVCIPADHPFKGKFRLSARELVNETMYWMPRSAHPALYREVTEYLYGVGIRAHNLREAWAVNQGIDLAANKLGIALVPQSAARFQCPGVLFKPLTDKLIRIETAIFARKDQMHGEISKFVHAAVAELRSKKTELH